MEAILGVYEKQGIRNGHKDKLKIKSMSFQSNARNLIVAKQTY